MEAHTACRNLFLSVLLERELQAKFIGCHNRLHSVLYHANLIAAFAFHIPTLYGILHIVQLFNATPNVKLVPLNGLTFLTPTTISHLMFFVPLLLQKKLSIKRSLIAKGKSQNDKYKFWLNSKSVFICHYFDFNPPGTQLTTTVQICGDKTHATLEWKSRSQLPNYSYWICRYGLYANFKRRFNHDIVIAFHRADVLHALTKPLN